MNEKSNSEKIEPIIQNKEIVSLKVNNKKIPLKKPMPLSFFSGEFLNSIEKIEEYIDFSNLFEDNDTIDEWEKADLEEFLPSLNRAQIIILKILSDQKEISRHDLVISFNKNTKTDREIDNKSLAGIVAGLNRRINSLKKEKLFSIYSDLYKLDEKYLPLIEDILNI